jgi:REP element-mobilizing transposase RayT
MLAAWGPGRKQGTGKKTCQVSKNLTGLKQEERMSSNPIPLEYGKVYHVYNRGNNGENLFIEERNYRYFLRLYVKHVHALVDTYAYCLLRNHFHLLIRVKTKAELKDLSGFQNLTGLKPPSRYFSNLFNAYAKAINRAYSRTGALFARPFRRIEVTDPVHFTHLVTYIHRNPEHHNFVDDFREWPYTSYEALHTEKPTRVRRDVVLGWFGGASAFGEAQQAPSVLDPSLMLEYDD